MNTVEAGRRIALKNILFATDFSSCSDAALPYAISIATRYGAEIHAAHVLPSRAANALLTSPGAWATFENAVEMEEQQGMQDLETDLKGIPHVLLTMRGSVAGMLTQIIQDREIDLLVLGTHGRSGLNKLVMGSVAEETFRRAACPVLSIGPGVSCEPDREIEFHRILFATDFSRESLAALPYAISFAEEDAARLAILHVVQQPAGIAGIDRVAESLRHRLRELVPADAELWCYVEPRVEFCPQFARSADRIIEVAHDLKADLIVLGVRRVHGAGLIAHLATTTAQILARASCPVLTVRG